MKLALCAGIGLHRHSQGTYISAYGKRIGIENHAVYKIYGEKDRIDIIEHLVIFLERETLHRRTGIISRPLLTVVFRRVAGPGRKQEHCRAGAIKSFIYCFFHASVVVSNCKVSKFLQILSHNTEFSAFLKFICRQSGRFNIRFPPAAHTFSRIRRKAGCWKTTPPRYRQNSCGRTPPQEEAPAPGQSPLRRARTERSPPAGHPTCLSPAGPRDR